MGNLSFIPRLGYFCCGCHLRTGSKFAGWFGVLLGTLALLYYLLYVLVVLTDENNDSIHITVAHWNWAHVTLFIFSVLVILFRILFSSILLMGVYQGKVGYYVPWLIFSMVGVALATIIILFLITQDGPVFQIVVIFFSACISFYVILVVYSDYRQQKERRQEITASSF